MAPLRRPQRRWPCAAAACDAVVGVEKCRWRRSRSHGQYVYEYWMSPYAYSPRTGWGWASALTAAKPESTARGRATLRLRRQRRERRWRRLTRSRRQYMYAYWM